MKKYFITGLITLLPLAVTFAVVSFLFNLLTGPFLNIFSSLLAQLGMRPESFFAFNSPQAFKIVVQLIILIFLMISTILLGILTRWFFLHSLIQWGEKILHRIPFISSIYKSCSDVVKTIFTSDTRAFKQVVLVPYPKSDTFSLGLVTCESMAVLREVGQDGLVAVFIPTTPNPTSGFLVLFKPEDITYLDMKIEEAFKYILSCGVISPELNVKSAP